MSLLEQLKRLQDYTMAIMYDTDEKKMITGGTEYECWQHVLGIMANTYCRDIKHVGTITF